MCKIPLTKLMKVILLMAFYSLGVRVVCCQGIHEFKSVAGNQSTVDGSLNGWTVSDHYGTSDHNGFVGDLGLIFDNQDEVASVAGTPVGTFRGDVGELYDGLLGVHAFCTDSETSFVGSGADTVQSYQAHNLASAEQRFLDENVAGYMSGGLKRAAYLLETYYASEVALGGDLESATMQSLIWEVLTDSSPDLSTGTGNYYLRNNTGNTMRDSRANSMIDLGNSWLADAVSNDWGGASYDPGNRVIFWQDPTALTLNQSVISLNVPELGIVIVPEPSSVLMFLMGGAMLFRRQRR